ncbi:MAG: PD-(D/E)XK nuclease family protein, partial [Bacteroidaceae bacterium]
QGELCSSIEQKQKSESSDEDETKIRMNLLHDEDNAHDITMSTHPPTMHFMQSEQARLYMHNLNDEAEEEKQEDAYIESGKLMHYALSLIGNADEASSVLDRLEAEGYADQSPAWKKARRAIEHGLTNSTIAQWFAPGKRCLRECGIITRDPDTGLAKTKRPDRVVMEPGLITVIDYKFGKRNTEYEGQVKEYMRQISAMYPEMRVEGYLWYVYSGQPQKVTLEEQPH